MTAHVVRAVGLALGLAITGTAVATPAAHAQQAAAQDSPSSSRDAEARALFEAGRVAFGDGRFEDALSYFQRSHELSGRPELLYNIATTADRLRREREAVEAFEGYLAAVPDAPNRREVEGRLRVLREEIAREETETAERAAREAAERDAAASVPAPDTGVAQGDGGEDVITSWWLWTIVGVVVAGAVAGAVVAGTTTTQDVYPEYMTGDGGAIAITLTVALP